MKMSQEELDLLIKILEPKNSKMINIEEKIKDIDFNSDKVLELTKGFNFFVRTITNKYILIKKIYNYDISQKLISLVLTSDNTPEDKVAMIAIIKKPLPTYKTEKIEIVT